MLCAETGPVSAASPPSTQRPARRNAAVGAVVADDRGQVLLLKRKVLAGGRWTPEVRLPKGPLQAGEPDAGTALHQARRLTGFLDLEVLADLGRAPAEYVHRGVRFRRQEHFFLLRLTSKRRRPADTPVDDEARTYELAIATDFDEAVARLSFSSEQEAVLRAKAWWPALG